MDSPHIISVNPGISNVGERLQEAARYNHTVKSIVTGITRRPKYTTLVNSLTGISSKTMSGTSGRILLLRIFTVLMLGAAVYYGPTAGMQPSLMIPAIVLGISLLLGFMTRIVSIGAMATFTYFAIQGPASPAICIALAFTALVFTILGPGIFSTDQFIRKGILRRANILRRAKKKSGRDIDSHSHPKFDDYRSYTRL